MFNSESDKTTFRYWMAKPLELLFDIDLFNYHKKEHSLWYMNICELVFYMHDNLDRFPKFKAFLWHTEGYGYSFSYFNRHDFKLYEEQCKLLHQILSLIY